MFKSLQVNWKSCSWLFESLFFLFLVLGKESTRERARDSESNPPVWTPTLTETGSAYSFRRCTFTENPLLHPQMEIFEIGQRHKMAEKNCSVQKQMYDFQGPYALGIWWFKDMVFFSWKWCDPAAWPVTLEESSCSEIMLWIWVGFWLSWFLLVRCLSALLSWHSFFNIITSIHGWLFGYL